MFQLLSFLCALLLALSSCFRLEAWNPNDVSKDTAGNLVLKSDEVRSHKQIIQKRFYPQRNNGLQSMLSKNPALTLGLKGLEDLKALRMGDEKLKIGLHQGGDASKLQRVLQKALRGERISVVVIGGSNSAGGGMDKDQDTLDRRYFKLFATWWNNTIGLATGSFVTDELIAIGGTGSYFFAFCYDTFLPDSNAIDIAIVEASVNYNQEGKSEPLEQLTRLLYSHKAQPAIFFVNFVSGLGKKTNSKKFYNPDCLNLENFGQTDVAQRYDITSFVMKDLVCPLKNGKRVIVLSKDGYVSPDQRHAGERAHARIALTIINYVKSVFDDVTREGQPVNLPQQIAIPASVFIKEDTKLLTNPQCYASITPDGEDNFQRPTLEVRVLKKHNFQFYSNGYDTNAKEKPSLRKDRQRGWGNEANKPGEIEFLIIVNSWNFTGSEKRRSIIALVHSMYNGAQGKIWIDDKESEAIHVNSMARPGGSNELFTIANQVGPGRHTVSAETDGKGGLFAISAILVGPPDFSRRKVT